MFDLFCICHFIEANIFYCAGVFSGLSLCVCEFACTFSRPLLTSISFQCRQLLHHFIFHNKDANTADTRTHVHIELFSHSFFCSAHLFFTHLFYVHPFKMLMHEFTSSIAFARTHHTHWRIHVLRITSTFVCFLSVCIHLSYVCGVCVCVSVFRTFVKLTFIRHKIHHFAKVKTLSQKKVSDANGNNIHHCSNAYLHVFRA